MGSAGRPQPEVRVAAGVPAGKAAGREGHPGTAGATVVGAAVNAVVGGLGHALGLAFAMSWEILWALILGFAISAAVQAVVSKAEMGRLLPDDSPRSLGIACTRDRLRAGCCLLVLLVCGGRHGPLGVPQGRRLHCRDGV